MYNAAGRREHSNDLPISFSGIGALPPSFDGVLPSERSGHRVFSDPDFFYIIGGYYLNSDGVRFREFVLREIWRFNMFSNVWQQLEPDNDFPRALASHSISKVKEVTRSFICYGGSELPFGGATSSQVHFVKICVNGKIHTKELSCIGGERIATYGHAMCPSMVEPKAFFVVGGTTGNEYNLSVYKLIIEDNFTYRWQRLDRPENLRNGLYRLEIVHDEVHDRIVLFGGGTPHVAAGFAYLTIFDLKTRRYGSVKTFADRKKGFPKQRRSHSLVRFGRVVLMAGGCAPDTSSDSQTTVKMRNDVWLLHLDTLQWNLLGRLFNPLFFHDASVNEEGTVLIWGGVTSPNSNFRTFKGQVFQIAPLSLRTLALRQLQRMFPDLMGRHIRQSENGRIIRFFYPNYKPP